jgi:hypothetical protein
MSGAQTRLDGTTLVVRIPMRFQRRGGQKRIVAADGSAIVPSSKPQPDRTLIKALARAWRWQRMLGDGVHATVSDIGDAERTSRRAMSAPSCGSRCWRPTSSRRSCRGMRSNRQCSRVWSGRCRQTGRSSGRRSLRHQTTYRLLDRRGCRIGSSSAALHSANRPPDLSAGADPRSRPGDDRFGLAEAIASTEEISSDR